MPNAGIHGARSTNWNSAEDASNPAHNARVTPNEASETASASQRMKQSRRPSALPMSSRSSAPASGSAQERVSILSQLPISNVQFPASPSTLGVGSWRLGFVVSSPQVVTENDNHAHEERAGIGAHRAGLEPSQHRGAAVDDRRSAVDGAVDDPHVEPAPQAFGRCGLDRLHD